jgi:hypothetical protein
VGTGVSAAGGITSFLVAHERAKKLTTKIVGKVFFIVAANRFYLFDFVVRVHHIFIIAKFSICLLL